MKILPYQSGSRIRYAQPVVYLDEKVIPGAEFGCDMMWLLPGEKSKAGRLIMDSNAFPPRYVHYFYCNELRGITDLCAEVEL